MSTTVPSPSPVPAAASLPAGGPSPTTLAARFERRAGATPDLVAVTGPGGSLSYRELNRRANRLAHLLTARGVGPGDRVGIGLGRTVGLPVAILAVLKAGAAYVPVDPAHPVDRIASTLADASVRLVIAGAEVGIGGTGARAGAGAGACADVGVGVGGTGVDGPVVLDPADPVVGAALDAGPDRDPVARTGPTDPAYVIFTSGSTGRPKGVVVTNANVAALLDGALPRFGFGPGEVWTLFHSHAFDFSVWELWGAWSTGGRVVIVPREVTWSPPAFVALLATEGVTVLNQTPSAFFALVEAERDRLAAGGAPLGLRTVIFGGEALEVSRLDRWWDLHPEGSPELVNMYGITETTVHVTWLPVDRAAAASGGSPIGDGLPGLDLHLLDHDLRPVVDGERGELYVGGAQVSAGYLGRPALTATRFVPDPFRPGGRLYRTGDHAVRRSGTLHYLGRVDGQVQIRGFRVELGEVEAALARHPDVANCAVTVHHDPDRGPQLVAHVVVSGRPGRPGGSVDTASLRRHLAALLPAHEVPSVYLPLDAVPLTVNGKLDRASLPAPTATTPTAPTVAAAARRRRLLDRRVGALTRQETTP